MKECYTRNKIKLLVKRNAYVCNSCLQHVMAMLYVSSVKSSLMAYEGLKCYCYQKNSGNLVE